MENNYLGMMLKIQSEFQEKYGYTPTIHELASAISCEGGELWAIAGGKWWKDYLKTEIPYGKYSDKNVAYETISKIETQNEAKIFEESIDIWHFLMCVWISLGKIDKDIYRAYCQKMGINERRQDTGY